MRWPMSEAPTISREWLHFEVQHPLADLLAHRWPVSYTEAALLESEKAA